MDKKYFNSTLKIENHIIGYKSEGESIVVLIKDGEIVEYTIVIDCFEKNQNKTYELLKKINIEYVDLLCWTHPDKDHSAGFEKLIEFINSDTIILIPDGFSDVADIWEKSNTVLYDFIYSETKKIRTNSSKVSIRKVTLGMVIVTKQFVNINTNEEYIFEVKIFAPSDNFIFKKTLLEKQISNNNLSIGMIVNIGEIVNIYASDVGNDVFEILNKQDFPEYVDYIKIPHHGSENSSKILSLIKNNPQIACTTTNARNKLPNKQLIEKYKIKVDKVFCTNNLEKDLQKDDYGIITTMFCITDLDEITTELEGNATECICNNLI